MVVNKLVGVDSCLHPQDAPQVSLTGDGRAHTTAPPHQNVPARYTHYYLVSIVASDMRVSLNIYVPLNVTKFDRHFFV